MQRQSDSVIFPRRTLPKPGPRRVARCAVLAAVWVGVAGSAAAQGPASDRLEGLDYVRLDNVAAYHGLRVKVDGLRLYSTHHDFIFTQDSRRATYNGEQVFLHEAAAELDENQWGITVADWRSLVDPLLRPALYLPDPGRVRVVLDPGHGGQDQGATNDEGLVEKRLTLEICRGIRDYLAGEEVDVILTRDADFDLDLTERAEFTARRGADLFVSVHFNSSANPQASGIETYVLPVAGHRSTSDNGDPPPDPAVYPGNTFDGSNMLLAQAIHRRMIRTLRAADRGIRKARFVVLRQAPCPAVLVECGFLSNGPEAKHIRSSYYRDAIAVSISAGVLDLLDKRRPDPASLHPASAAGESG